MGGKNPSPLFLSLSILPTPPSPPPPAPSRRDSNQTFHSVHLWNWKFPALNGPLWQIKKSGFGGLTWNCRRYSVRFYTLMGQFWNSVVCEEESLLKPVVGWLVDWLIDWFSLQRLLLKIYGVPVWAWLNGGICNWALIGFTLITTTTSVCHRQNIDIIYIACQLCTLVLSLLATLKFYLPLLALEMRIEVRICSVAVAALLLRQSLKGVYYNRKMYWFPLQCCILQESSILSHTCFASI